MKKSSVLATRAVSEWSIRRRLLCRRRMVKGQSTEATALLRSEVAAGRPFVIPALWLLEVAQTLLMLMRRRRIAPADRRDARGFLIELGPDIDEDGWRLAFGTISDLALEHSLTVYDATYLELAIRRGLPLASRDDALNKAARNSRVETLL